MEIISYLDSAENLYHGFLAGVLRRKIIRKNCNRRGIKKLSNMVWHFLGKGVK